MKLPTAKHYSGNTAWDITAFLYGLAIVVALGFFFLFYASGYWVGLYSVPCQFSASQPKCAAWRTQRNDQHLNGNFKIQVQPGQKP